MLKLKITVLAIFALIFLSCRNERKPLINIADKLKSSISEDTLYMISADLETDPVDANTGEDSADDPVIFRLAGENSTPVIAGSNKISGIHFYDISGKEIGFINCGRINNIDTRCITMPDGEKLVLLAGSNRSLNTLTLITISGKSLLPVNSHTDFPSGLDEVYGLSFYQNPLTEECFVFINSKTGAIEQWKIQFEGNQIKPVFARKLYVPSQPEGMVADDLTGYLYVAEEHGGIHIFNADPESESTYRTIPLSDSLNPMISYDIEGLSIYRTGDYKNYLVASIQGNNTFAIFDLTDHRYISSFGIKDGSTDSVEETDGIDIFNTYASDRFPEGIMVVQDGFNKNRDTIAPQNFKIVDLRKISGFIKPTLQ